MTRAARIEDCARIGEIHVEGWRAAYRGIMPDSLLAGLSYEKRAGGWRIAIERDPGSVVVIEDKGIIFGWAAIGSGTSLACATLLQLAQHRTSPLEDTLYAVASAKFASERGRGIGHTSLHMSISHKKETGKPSPHYVLSDNEISVLRQL